jgi:hypothetical protein
LWTLPGGDRSHHWPVEPKRRFLLPISPRRTKVLLKPLLHSSWLTPDPYRTLGRPSAQECRLQIPPSQRSFIQTQIVGSLHESDSPHLVSQCFREETTKREGDHSSDTMPQENGELITGQAQYRLQVAGEILQAVISIGWSGGQSQSGQVPDIWPAQLGDRCPPRGISLAVQPLSDFYLSSISRGYLGRLARRLKPKRAGMRQ